MNKQNDTDLSGVITSILILFYAVTLMVGVYAGVYYVLLAIT